MVTRASQRPFCLQIVFGKICPTTGKLPRHMRQRLRPHNHIATFNERFFNKEASPGHKCRNLGLGVAVKTILAMVHSPRSKLDFYFRRPKGSATNTLKLITWTRKDLIQKSRDISDSFILCLEACISVRQLLRIVIFP